MTVSRQSSAQVAEHSSINDFSATPGSPVFFRPRNIDQMGPRDYVRLEREVVDQFNYGALDVIGPKDVGPFSFDIDFTGASGAEAAAITPSNSMELALLLKAIFGTETATTGTGTTVAAAGGATAVNVVSTTNNTTGMPCAFEVDSVTGAREVRWPTVTSATVLTCERALSAIPTTGSTVWRGARYQASADTPMRIPLYFDVETEAWRVQWFGCIPSAATITAADGGKVTLSSTWMPNDWISTHTQSNPTVSLPSTGLPTLGKFGYLWIGAEKFYVSSASIDAGIAVAERPATADNGRRGVAITRQDPVIKCKVYGSGTQALTGGMAFGGATVDMADLQDGTGRDVMIQFDTRRGAIVAARMANANCRAKRITENGLEMLELEFKATRLSSGNGYPMQLAVF